MWRWKLAGTSTRGQSIAEVVFAVGLTIVALSGVVMLVITSLGAKNRVAERKVASTMGQVIVENLIAQSVNDVGGFWALQNVTGQRLTGFPDDYTYDVVFDSDRLGCSDCTEATITVRWTRDVGNSMVFVRFFSR